MGHRTEPTEPREVSGCRCEEADHDHRAARQSVRISSKSFAEPEEEAPGKGRDDVTTFRGKRCAGTRSAGDGGLR